MLLGTKEVKARLWMEHWAGSQGAADLLHELRHISHSPELQQCLSIAVLSPAVLKQHHILAHES